MPLGLVEKWRDTFGDCNVGTATGGATGLLVVDIDTIDREVWERCIRLYGDTPAQVLTASGELHLWYASPSGTCTAQRLNGEPIDIRADRGFIVLPPSIRPGVGTYSWFSGGVETLKELPQPKNLVPRGGTGPKSGGSAATAERGTRNTALFDHLRSIALTCATEEQLVAAGVEWNTALTEPLDTAEVSRTAKSVWTYKEQNRLIPPGHSTIILPRSAVEELAAEQASAFSLLAILQKHHAGMRSEFIISIKGMARCLKWSERRLRQARETLVSKGYLQQVKAGGRYPGDTSKFRLAPHW